MFRREFEAIQRSHLIWVCSDFELRLANILQPDLETDLVTFFYPDSEISQISSKAEAGHFGRRKNFVWIGNFMHKPNYDSCRKLVDQIWPILYEQFPDTCKPELHLYGSNFPKDIVDLGNPNSGVYCKVTLL